MFDRTPWIPGPGSRCARALQHVGGLASGGPLDRSLHVTLQFHPDRLHRGEPLLRVLARDSLYRSQFETGTSNGGLTAHPGGDRWAWESRMFAGAYDDAPAEERPKYGALNYRRRATGGAPRFGSSFLRLKPQLLARTTFCYPDSVFEPRDFGTMANMALIELAESDRRDPLDDAIEAHVHGPVRLASDVEALVLDPSYRGTAVEELAGELPCVVEWHPGFVLTTDVLARHPDYRGPEFVALGLALARDGVLTPALLGEAARSGRYDAQALKRVWHYVARFGDPGAHRD
ncbi:DUF3626 domain-containing protein [Ramlibacter algicola]|uniref:DUF3626 domain-containing protein n=1 Tax=Ramlibacter algicola TaxID=2795217 RepID=A0A934Q660_9BURK|nr:DUF3626 domain-containing protein [Ramlibacter algicola]MBK0394902.1 DUF3626 domain-containing protein [Ramlibacter algicola]